MSDNKKYVMYLRKSRYDPDFETQSLEDTIGRHKAVLDKYASSNGLNVVQVFSEVVSGESISSRPEMMKLLGVISEENIEGILCMDIDRLARGNSIDQGIISQTLQYTNTKVITPYKIYDPANEFDEEYMEFSLFMSRKEYKIINRRLENGRRQSAAEGRFMGGAAPYGYEMVKLKGEKGNTLRIIPEQAEVVRKVFDLYCNRGYGYVRLANLINELGIPSAKGGKWSVQTIRQMLHNAVYAGYIRRGFKKVVKKLEDGVIVRHRAYDNNCELFPGKHEAIIEKSMFDKAQTLGSINTKNKTNKQGTFHYIFSGIMYCAECGQKIYSTNNSREARPEHKHRVICRNPSCSQMSTKQLFVENAVRPVLKEWLIKYRVEDNNKEPSRDGISSLSLIENSINKALAQRNKIHELFETEVYDLETFRARDSAITAKLNELYAVKEKAAKESEKKKISREEALPKIHHLLSTWETSSAEEKNRLLRQIISRINYHYPKDGDLKLDIFPNF